jgi:Glutathione-dependent formaldehyde-activating enzyme
MQAGFKADQVRIDGRYTDYSRVSDEADRKEHVLHFCPECGSHVFYTEPEEPDLVVVSVGSFADPSFPPPTESGYDSRRHPWIGLPESMRLLAPEVWWNHGQPLYEAGKYSEAADKGLELIEARPDQPYLFYTSPVARASRAELPTRLSTFVRRSRCGRTAGGWRETTRTST